MKNNSPPPRQAALKTFYKYVFLASTLQQYLCIVGCKVENIAETPVLEENYNPSWGLKKIISQYTPDLILINVENTTIHIGSFRNPYREFNPYQILQKSVQRMLHSILDPTEIHIENCTIHIRSYRNKDREYTIHIRSHRNKERKFYNPYWILQK